MKTTTLGFLGFLLIASSGFAQKEDDAAKKEEAKTALKEFKVALKSVESESALIDALNALAKVQHSTVLDELKKWLTGQTAVIKKVVLKDLGSSATSRDEVTNAMNRGMQNVRGAVAEGIAKYKKDKKAAEALVGAAHALKEPDTQAKFLECAGDTECKDIDKKICAFFGDRETDVAKAAIDATTKLKTKYCIVELIKNLKMLEGISEDQTGAGSPDMPGPGGGGVPTQENEQIKRKRELLPAVKQALRGISGEQYDSGKEWDLWWRKNQATYKEPD